MKKFAVVLSACAVFSGCATSQQQIDSHAPAMNSWVGAPIEDFLGVQGDPRVVDDNRSYQTYKFGTSKTKRVTESGRDCGPQSNFNEPINDYGQTENCTTVERHRYTITYWCSYGLIVVEDVIRDWVMDGNNCRMITIAGRPGSAETS